MQKTRKPVQSAVGVSADVSRDAVLKQIQTDRARERVEELCLRPKPPFEREEFVSLDSYKARVERARGLFHHLAADEYHAFVTIRFNDENLTRAKAEKRLCKLDTALNRRYLGKNYSRVPSERRLWFVAVPEGIDETLHYHLLVHLPKVPGRHKRAYFTAWMRFDLGDFCVRLGISRSKDIVVKTIGESWHQGADAAYMIKQAWKAENCDDFIDSRFYHCSSKAR